MKPLRLRIKGIKNYITEQIIDFESLSSEGVFGICGNSGSGKSAIIDSIIIALYGDLPNNLNYRNYDIVNLTDKTAEIDFVFSLNVGNQNKIYQISRKLQPYKSTKMVAEIFDITDKKISLAEGVRDVNNYVTDLLKLNVNDFAKCVVLVQGEYDKFISQNDSARKQMIGNIFSLDKYGEELNKKVLEQKRELESTQKIHESILESLGHIDQKTIDDKTKELKDLQDGQIKITQKKKELEKSYFELEKSYKEFIEYQKLASEIQNIKNDIELKKHNIEKLSIDYQAAAEATKQQTELTQKKEQLKSYIDSLNKNSGIEAKIKILIEKKQKKAEEYKKISADIKSYTQELENTEKAQNDISILIQEQLKLLEQSAKITLEFDDNLPVKITEEYSAFSKKTEKFKDLSKQLKEVIENIQSKQQELDALVAIQAKSLKEQQQCKKDLDEKKEQYEHISMHNAASLLKSRVSIGDHCPVCNNIITQLQQDNENNQNIDDIKKQIDFFEKGLFDINATVAANAQKISTLEKELEENKIKEKTIQEELNSFDYDCSKINDIFSEVKEKCIKLTDQLNKGKTKKQEMTKTLDVLKLTLKTIEQEGKDLKEQINELESTLKEILGSFDSLHTALKSSEIVYKELDEKIKKIIETERAAERALTQEKSELEKAQIKLESLIREISKLNSKEVNQDQLHAEKQKLDDHTKLEREYTQKIGALTGEIERLKNDLIKYNHTQKELTKTQKRLDLVKELHKLTQSNKLMEFMAQEYIYEFTYTASEYLNKLTMGQFELEYDNGFYIKDYLNSGQYRNVSTVSGGEKFLVSLSLAIAISRALSRRAGAAAVEFLFIDEGFGTLDSDLIDTVMDTLDKLKGNFIIGLISHRQELQQRLPKKLIIAKHDGDLTISQV
ncbi:MAG TPA: SMC family ATPase [Clostridia bacterium]